jgi:hypothetical protein
MAKTLQEQLLAMGLTDKKKRKTSKRPVKGLILLMKRKYLQIKPSKTNLHVIRP